MKIHFLATYLADVSGGAIYDKNFFNILRNNYPNVKLFNDSYFIDRYNGGSGLVSFNRYYSKSIDELLDCDYLVMNSRLYTRMILINFKSEMKKHPKLKIVVIHHHSNFMNNNGLLKQVHKWLEKRVLECASEVIIPNEYVIDQVQKDFAISKIVSLPSSFEKKRYKISPLSSNIILFVGNIEKRKGIIYGLMAFKIVVQQYPNLEYHIVGKYDENDAYYKKLKKYVVENRLEKNVIFEGRVSDERLGRLYANAKLFLFPSMLEGYGWVMVEAMAHGVPVVAFDNSAMPYTVKDGKNGLLVKNKDIVEMSTRICEVLSKPELLKLLQDGALRTYELVPSQDELNRLTEEYIMSWR